MLHLSSVPVLDTSADTSPHCRAQSRLRDSQELAPPSPSSLQGCNSAQAAPALARVTCAVRSTCLAAQPVVPSMSEPPQCPAIKVEDLNKVHPTVSTPAGLPTTTPSGPSGNHPKALQEITPTDVSKPSKPVPAQTAVADASGGDDDCIVLPGAGAPGTDGEAKVAHCTAPATSSAHTTGIATDGNQGTTPCNEPASDTARPHPSPGVAGVCQPLYTVGSAVYKAGAGAPAEVRTACRSAAVTPLEQPIHKGQGSTSHTGPSQSHKEPRKRAIRQLEDAPSPQKQPKNLLACRTADGSSTGTAQTRTADQSLALKWCDVCCAAKSPEEFESSFQDPHSCCNTCKPTVDKCRSVGVSTLPHIHAAMKNGFIHTIVAEVDAVHRRAEVREYPLCKEPCALCFAVSPLVLASMSTVERMDYRLEPE